MIAITGTRVVLNSKGCCSPHVIVARVDDQCSAYEFRCGECNSRRGRLPDAVVEFLRDTWRVFGPPHAPIYLRGLTETEMKREDLFPSAYFNGTNVPKSKLLKILKAELESIKTPQGEGVSKLCLTFDGEQKKLLLNATNFDAIAAEFGEETDGWAGGEIEIYADKSRMGGKVVPCVRVRPTPPTKECEVKE